MKKRLAAVFAATAVLGVTTAFAANPFSDVTPQDWAYQAVSQLAAEGVVNGYPDGTFKGQNNITRYEMAQMIAKAMARQDRNNAEQQAMINRLAEEFAAELNNLGVRVSTLENKVGNFKFRGDARLRWEKEEHGNSTFDMRGRVTFNAAVNDNTKAVIRVASSNYEFGDATAKTEAKIDRVYVTHNFGKYFNLTAGRHNAFVGQGLVYDDAFDGVTASFGKERINGAVSYGYLNALKVEDPATGKMVPLSKDDAPEVVVYQLAGQPLKDTTVSAFYLDAHKDGDGAIYGVGLDSMISDKVWVGGEWARVKGEKHSNAWTAGLGYGKYDITKKGTWDVKAQYFSFNEVSPVVATTWDVPYTEDYKGWGFTADYALAKNVGLTAFATVDSKEKSTKADLPEYYKVEVNYKF